MSELCARRAILFVGAFRRVNIARLMMILFSSRLSHTTRTSAQFAHELAPSLPPSSVPSPSLARCRRPRLPLALAAWPPSLSPLARCLAALACRRPRCLGRHRRALDLVCRGTTTWRADKPETLGAFVCEAPLGLLRAKLMLAACAFGAPNAHHAGGVEGLLVGVASASGGALGARRAFAITCPCTSSSCTQDAERATRERAPARRRPEQARARARRSTPQPSPA